MADRQRYYIYATYEGKRGEFPNSKERLDGVGHDVAALVEKSDISKKLSLESSVERVRQSLTYRYSRELHVVVRGTTDLSVSEWMRLIGPLMDDIKHLVGESHGQLFDDSGRWCIETKELGFHGDLVLDTSL